MLTYEIHSKAIKSYQYVLLHKRFFEKTKDNICFKTFNHDYVFTVDISPVFSDTRHGMKMKGDVCSYAPS